MFSIDRFFPSTGGRLPILRYLSKSLLNRITFSEKDAISRFVPGVINNLPHDADYNPELERQKEVLQSWETLKSLNKELLAEDITESLKNCIQSVRFAGQTYNEIASLGIVQIRNPMTSTLCRCRMDCASLRRDLNYEQTACAARRTAFCAYFGICCCFGRGV